MATKVEEARGEINETLSLCLFCMRWIGLSFEPPASARAYMRQKLMFIVSVCAIVYHVFSEIVYIGLTVSNSPRVEDVVPLFHTFGYGALSESSASSETLQILSTLSIQFVKKKASHEEFSNFFLLNLIQNCSTLGENLKNLILIGN